MKAGDLGEAQTLCRRLMERNKRDPVALQVMGMVAFQRNQFEEAAAWLGKHVALQPRDVNAHSNLAKVHAARGQLARAHQCFDKALRVKRDDPGVLAAKADLFEHQGETEGARELLESRIVDGRETPHMALVYAKLLRREGKLDDAITLIQKHLAESQVTDHLRRQLLFALGQVSEKAEAYEQAFEAYRDGNEIDKRSFDPGAYAAKIDALIETFSAENLASLPRSTVDSLTPVFIVGMPRTGSTLVERILDAHPKAHGVGEIKAMPQIVSSLMYDLGSYAVYPGCIADLTVEEADRIAKLYLDQVKVESRKASVVVDKFLANYESLGLIELLLPNARIIDCRRDPLDTCWSCYAQTLMTRYHAYASDLEHLGLVYREYDRLMVHWAQVISLPMLTIRYEELVADQEPMIRKILDFCGLKWDDNCLRFHESDRDVMTLSYEQVKRPMYSASVGRHRHFLSHLEPLRHALETGA